MSAKLSRYDLEISKACDGSPMTPNRLRNHGTFRKTKPRSWGKPRERFLS